jgi:hypothetical protein
MGGELSTRWRKAKVTRPSQENMKERKFSEGTHAHAHTHHKHAHKLPITIGENPELYYSAIVWKWSEIKQFSAKTSMPLHDVRGRPASQLYHCCWGKHELLILNSWHKVLCTGIMAKYVQ